MIFVVDRPLVPGGEEGRIDHLDWFAVPTSVLPTLPTTVTRARENAVVELLRVSPLADELARRFAAEGHRLYLVGGSVRDALDRKSVV